jgi:hypothetical protein
MAGRDVEIDIEAITDAMSLSDIDDVRSREEEIDRHARELAFLMVSIDIDDLRAKQVMRELDSCYELLYGDACLQSRLQDLAQRASAMGVYDARRQELERELETLSSIFWEDV